MKLLNCCNIGCESCNKAILVGKNLLGDKMYICEYFQKKHKVIKAIECSKFVCKNRGEFPIVCNTCRG